MPPPPTPPSLYEVCLEAAVADCAYLCKFCKKGFRSLPNNVLFDFYYKMYQERRVCLLGAEFSDLEIFKRMLLVKHKRLKMLQCFQALVEHCCYVLCDLIELYAKNLQNCDMAEAERNDAIDCGIRMGSFFNESGWYANSVRVLNIAESILKQHNCTDVKSLRKYLECYHRRIYAETIDCQFDAAAATFQSANTVVAQLQAADAAPNLGGLYANFSMYYYHRFEYDAAYQWAHRAMTALASQKPSPAAGRIVVDVLRHTAKVCVIKRHFSQAGVLIRQAVNMDAALYASDGHPHYADTLLDYGFYLLNFDAKEESVDAYRRSLDIRKSVFGKDNVLVALAHEDMAYAEYVNEYNSGQFYAAKEHAEMSIQIMERILPADHLRLSSTYRVKALILEEIALDLRNNNASKEEYFSKAEQLHKNALAASYRVFGEHNVQTAKHYGNLGRLYQSMCLYNEAEEMHLRAIRIKQDILGRDDYEVGLSIGHLASLYNYHMDRYADAEVLYKRSMCINLKLFGEQYSGFEYDYRGLINVYRNLNNSHNAEVYTRKLHHWELLRSTIKPLHRTEELKPIEQIINTFFKMC